MKRSIIPTSLVLLFLLCCCDSTESRQIERAAYGYLDALGNYRIDDARPYATQQTCDVTLDFFNHIMPMVDTAYVISNTPAEIVIKSVCRETDTTAYVLFHKSTPIIQQDDTLRMVKRDGRWLAHVVIVVPQLFNQDTSIHERRITREMARTLKPVDIRKHTGVIQDVQ